MKFMCESQLVIPCCKGSPTPLDTPTPLVTPHPRYPLPSSPPTIIYHQCYPPPRYPPPLLSHHHCYPIIITTQLLPYHYPINITPTIIALSLLLLYQSIDTPSLPPPDYLPTPGNCGDNCLDYSSNYLSLEAGAIGRHVLFLGLQGIVYFMILIVIEMKLVLRIRYALVMQWGGVG